MSGNEANVQTRVTVTGGDTVEAQAARLRAIQDRLAKQNVEMQRQVGRATQGLKRYGDETGVLDVRMNSLTKSLRGFSGLLGGGTSATTRLGAAFTDLTPVLQDVEAGFTKVDASGKKTVSGMGKVAGTLGKIAGPAAAAAAGAELVGKGLAYLADQVNRLDGERERLEAIFSGMGSLGENAGTRDASGDLVRKLEQMNAQLKPYGVFVTSITEGHKRLAEIREREAALIRSWTTDIAAANQSLDTFTAQMLKAADAQAGGAGLIAMSRQQLTAMNAALDEQIAKYVETGRAVPEALAKINAQVDKLLGIENVGHAWETARQASKAFAESQADLAKRLDAVTSMTALTKAGQMELVQEFIEAAERAKTLDKSLSDGLTKSLERLGLTTENAKAKLEELANGPGKAWWDNPAIGKSIEEQAKSLKEKQIEAWKAADEERQRLDKAAVDAAVEKFRQEFGVVIPETAAILNTQFGTAVVSAAQRAKTVLSQLGKALAGAMNQGARGGGGGGGGSSSGQSSGGVESDAKALLAQEAALKRKEDELEAIKKRFSRRGGYSREVARRQEEIDQMRRDINEAQGKKRGAGDRITDKFADLKADNSKSLEQRNLERELGRQSRAAERTAQASERTAGIAQASLQVAKQQAARLDLSNELLRASGLTQQEIARHAAQQNQKSRLPSAFNIRTRTGGPASAGTVTAGGTRGSGGGTSMGG